MPSWAYQRARAQLEGGCGALDGGDAAHQLPLELFLGVEAAIDGEPRRARDDVEVGPGSGRTDDKHGPARGQLARFDRPEQLMSFLGLVPSEHSTSERRRQAAREPAGFCWAAATAD